VYQYAYFNKPLLESKLTRWGGPQLNAYNDIQAIFKAPPRAADLTNIPPAEILMLIDASYSHTTITPLLLGKPLQSGIRRLEVGGKLLTNHLRNLLNQRASFDLSNETYIIGTIKEEACYVSKDFKSDLELTWRGPKGDRKATYEMGGGIAKDYVLPNFKTGAKGYMRDHTPLAKIAVDASTGRPLDSEDDIVTLRNERFSVPELLFNPLDIGIAQSGVAQQVMDSLSMLPMGLWPGFLANIVVVGGTANLDGFIYRLQMEIRGLAPAECIVRVTKAPDPIISTWRGGANLARDEGRLKGLSVTKEEYDEYGAGWVARKFGVK
jgi:actin-related protein 6